MQRIYRWLIRRLDRQLTASEFAEIVDATRIGRGKWKARCPSHDDRSPSLSILSGDDGRVLMFCHAGCSTREVADSVGIRVSDLFNDVYRNRKRKVELVDLGDEGVMLDLIARRIRRIDMIMDRIVCSVLWMTDPGTMHMTVGEKNRLIDWSCSILEDSQNGQ